MSDPHSPRPAGPLRIRKRVLGEEHPDTLDTLNNLAVVYSTQGRHDEAIPRYTKLIELNPDDYGCYLNRAEAYIMTGKNGT